MEILLGRNGRGLRLEEILLGRNGRGLRLERPPRNGGGEDEREGVAGEIVLAISEETWLPPISLIASWEGTELRVSVTRERPEDWPNGCECCGGTAAEVHEMGGEPRRLCSHCAASGRAEILFETEEGPPGRYLSDVVHEMEKRTCIRRLKMFIDGVEFLRGLGCRNHDRGDVDWKSAVETRASQLESRLRGLLEAGRCIGRDVPRRNGSRLPESLGGPRFLVCGCFSPELYGPRSRTMLCKHYLSIEGPLAAAVRAGRYWKENENGIRQEEIQDRLVRFRWQAIVYLLLGLDGADGGQFLRCVAEVWLRREKCALYHWTGLIGGRLVPPTRRDLEDVGAFESSTESGDGLDEDGDGTQEAKKEASERESSGSGPPRSDRQRDATASG